MRLDSAQLAAFAAVIEEGGFDGAARRLHVTPSAISQRVKALEGRVGQVLVRRTRPARPTEAGQVLVRLAGQVSLLEADALADVAGQRGGAPERPRISVAVNADSLASWFLPALAGLPAEIAICFDIHQEDQDHSAELLRDGSVMAAVTAEPRAVPGCRVEPIGSMRYRAVASPDYHRRYLSAGTAADALAGAPTLIFNRKDKLQQRFLAGLAGAEIDPPATFLPSSWAFVEAARLGLGWGMVPERMIQGELADGRLVEIAAGRHLDVPLYWQRWRLDSPVLTALTRSVHAAAAAALIRAEDAGSGRAGVRRP